MRKSLTYKVLAAVLTLSAANWAVPANVLAGEVDTDGKYIVTDDGETISDSYNGVYGNGHSFTINGGTIDGDVFGVGNENYTEDASGGNVTINGNATVTGNVFGGYSDSKIDVTNNYVTINNSTISKNVYGGYSRIDNTASGNTNGNHVIINNSSATDVFGGYSHGDIGSSGNADGNYVTINNSTINGQVRGGYSKDSNANGNHVTIINSTITGNIYGGYNGGVSNTEMIGNTVTIKGYSDITDANIYGGYCDIVNPQVPRDDNTLILDGWSGTAKSIYYFENIEFKNTTFTNGTVLNSQEQSNLAGLENIKITNFAGGQNFNKGETLTLIKNTNNTTINEQNFNATAGVAVDVGGVIKQDGNNVIMTVNSTNLNSQTNLAVQTRAASAAFVNQGTDLISDSLDTISRDSSYGVKTFAAVHGNRSKYDIADDIKINGWSTIVGVGNADKFDNGSELSWGVFYENGSGNYRTYNSFNNDFFRGDGSMVYNGGGIAARYENKNGVYTEGSLRAGMLKNELDNAMRDVNGSYGYETESAYYGAHIGVGKIISLSDSSDLDIYSKFFHTYTEGDSVTIAGDKFDFDSITSDRLRVGARITSNKENKFSTYYGLAYEYEFNGDADMTAQGLRADTQSLQGSSVMAEVGFNYQPTPDSPWSFDLNMRGYTGERQGGSFNVQATYTF